ncbi:MAG: GNAT family N-acetyltransferase [Chitinophagales bacterium]|nr:GNAT family N-acetyltransferase [Chitinophagales bacterium]
MPKMTFRKAHSSDIFIVWDILQQAIARRKADGSNQWQDGYPNPQIIQRDIEKDAAFVLVNGKEIIGYIAIFINDEPEYAHLKGKWLTQDDFVVFHRVALADKRVGKGLAHHFFQIVEDFALSHQIYSIKADTNFDNTPMLKLFDKMGYTYCGEVYFRGSPRRAYEKILSKN